MSDSRGKVAYALGGHGIPWKTGFVRIVTLTAFFLIANLIAGVIGAWIDVYLFDHWDKKFGRYGSFELDVRLYPYVTGAVTILFFIAALTALLTQRKHGTDLVNHRARALASGVAIAWIPFAMAQFLRAWSLQGTWLLPFAGALALCAGVMCIQPSQRVGADPEASG